MMHIVESLGYGEKVRFDVIRVDEEHDSEHLVQVACQRMVMIVLQFA